MGGGVSLGAFSGAALTEAVKLILVEIIKEQGPYNDVVIDLFSGASAGGMALGILLRGLYSQGDQQKQKAAQDLEDAFGPAFMRHARQNHGILHDKLVAAQVAQNIQKDIWVKQVDIDHLLPEKPEQVRFQAGILDRGYLEYLAVKCLRWKDGEPNPPQPGRSLLNEQVLFACTLANITPLMADARLQFPSDQPSLLGLRDGLRTKYHRDLRIFDINLGDAAACENPDRHHMRWVKMCGHPGHCDELRDLNKPQSWGLISSTTIACGAFPGAFEPVPLNRWREEYGWTSSSKDKRGDWPQGLRDKEEHVFTFMDGGTFNNEPIREAFRMASFIESHLEDDLPYERRILFVDPFVSSETVSLFAPVNRKYHATRGHGDQPCRASSLDRLLKHGGSVVSLLINEGRVIEADKIFRTRNYFKLRTQARQVIANLEINPIPGQDPRQAVSIACTEMLDKDRQWAIIPAGRLTLPGEVQRVQRELGLPVGQGEPDLKTLLYVYVDLLMRLGGKREGSELVAVGPFRLIAGPKRGQHGPLAGAAPFGRGHAGFQRLHEPGRPQARLSGRAILRVQHIEFHRPDPRLPMGGCGIALLGLGRTAHSAAATGFERQLYQGSAPPDSAAQTDDRTFPPHQQIPAPGQHHTLGRFYQRPAQELCGPPIGKGAGRELLGKTGFIQL